MVYIHTKKVGDRRYYTLRLSVRDKNGNIITKDLENLGTDITKIHIENLEKKYKKEIRKSYRTLKVFLESHYYLDKIKKKKLKKNPFFSRVLFEEIEATRLHSTTTFHKLDPNTKREVYEMFLIKFAVSSSGIEGNTITLKEANRLFTEDILPKNRTLREVYDLQNTKKVFFELLEKMPPLSLTLIEKVHDQLLDKIDFRKGYRSDDINIFGQPFKPSPGRYVKQDMKLLLHWYKKYKKKIHPLALAFFFHHKFENIHPFSDGNGRTGRMLMNLILLRKGYPPLLVLKTLRKEYLSVMSEADNALKKDLLSLNMEQYQRLFSFMGKQSTKTYWNTFLV